MASFRVDTGSFTFGIISSKGEYKAKSNFSIELETYVEAGSNTVFFAYVTKKSDKERRFVGYNLKSRYFSCDVYRSIYIAYHN